MLRKYLLNLWLIFVAVHLSHGLSNSVCYIKTSKSKMCEDPEQNKECCPESMSKIKIRVHHIDECDTMQTCRRDPAACCFKDDQMERNVSEAEFSALEAVFKSTECFYKQRRRLLRRNLPQTEGIYFVTISYTCPEETDRGNTTKTEGKTTVSKGKTIETEGKTTETEGKTTETIERLPIKTSGAYDEDRDGDRGGLDSLAVSIPVTVAVIALAAVAVCYIRRKPRHRGENILIAESSAAIEPSGCFHPAPDNSAQRYHQLRFSSDSGNYAVIPADRNSCALELQETRRYKHTTDNPGTLPTLRDFARGTGEDTKNIDDKGFDHTSTKSMQRTKRGEMSGREETFDVGGNSNEDHGFGPNNGKCDMNVYDSLLASNLCQEDTYFVVDHPINDSGESKPNDNVGEGDEPDYFVLEKHVDSAKPSMGMYDSKLSPKRCYTEDTFAVVGHSMDDAEDNKLRNDVGEVLQAGVSSKLGDVSSDGHEVTSKTFRVGAQISDDHDGVEPNYFVLEKQVNNAKPNMGMYTSTLSPNQWHAGDTLEIADNLIDDSGEINSIANVGEVTNADVPLKHEGVSEHGQEVTGHIISAGAEITGDHDRDEHYFVLEKQFK